MTTLSLLPEDVLLLVVHFTDVDSALSLLQVGIRTRNCRDWRFSPPTCRLADS
jgi:hypothetical protein